MKLTIFLMLRANPSWLALPRHERSRIGEAALAEAFGEFGDKGLSLRFFDAEAFNARVSDVAMIEAGDPKTWYFAMERLRDSPLIADGHFEVVEIVPAFEDGYRTFEASGDAA
ncbi:darcynin family protein [Chachezhania sediminis]|uniref:darcynin family protein n=1 Tax=Chachezhania sediminis TaxID=2599291 RepID=UPI00131B8A18|nr:darcynin family protein [Chachezhania sediminis]